MKTLLASLLFITTFSVNAYHKGDTVRLLVLDGCHACQEAEATLRRHHIPFTTSKSDSVAPQLYVNGKYVGTGSDAVEYYVNH